jgi:hypothetical protein
MPRHFFEKYKTVRRRSQQGTQQGVKEQGPCVPTTGPHGRAHLPLKRCFDAILDSTNSTWPKTDYIKDPSGNLGGGGETRN